ncbi:MAG: SPOR domain-containing protein [Deltaproteobacteria bacterium]|nr:SPOR domain-containing protein [Deltaproteobacteria bacterium]
MVRDLEKLRTRSEFRLRTGHLVLIIAATAVGGGILFAVGTAVARSGPDEGKAAKAKDPFAGLENASPTRTAGTSMQVAATAVPDPSDLPPLHLSFHDRLANPVPGAAPIVATADAEPPAPLDPVESPLPVDLPAAPRPDRNPSAGTTRLPAAPPPAPQAVASIPALPPGVPMAPAPVQSARDPMAPPLSPGQAQPQFEEEITPPLAQAGEHGVFTLQVSSFDDQDQAVAFMNMLRQRGHDSFLVRANCGDRGIVYRVRVGPFASQAEAERYRRKFERTERIPTFVVRRTLPVPG